MREFVNILRNIFFTDFAGEINLYTILSSTFKFIFVFIVLYYIYIIVKLITLDIKNIDLVHKVEKSFVSVRSPHGGQEKFILENVTSIGRNLTNDIVLQSGVVSKHHADIVESDGSYYIVDQNSSNGTLLNGELVTDNLELLNGDILSIGEYELIYTREEAESGSDS